MARQDSEYSASWVLDQPIEVTSAGGHRIQLPVQGEPLWFESADVPLRATVEVFVLAVLFSALHRRVRIRTRVPIDAQLREGLHALARVYHEWWQYRPDVVQQVSAADVGVRASSSSRATGSCFSGGVDSFYRLLGPPQPVDALVFVHGFDIPLGDRARWEQAERTVRGVAAAMGKQSIVVRTNLREHPVFEGVDWSRAHGAALAAVGQALAETLDTLIIPPSFATRRLQPWGSDPRTDPLLSSSRLRILHPPSDDGRRERIQAIAGHPLVRRHLRVCYENRSRTGNCSRCEKCLSTMTTLAGLRVLEAFEVFDHRVPLERRLDRLPNVAHHNAKVWREIASMDHRPEVSAALERLLQRQPPTGMRRAWHRAQRWLERRWLRAA